MYLCNRRGYFSAPGRSHFESQYAKVNNQDEQKEIDMHMRLKIFHIPQELKEEDFESFANNMSKDLSKLNYLPLLN